MVSMLQIFKDSLRTRGHDQINDTPSFVNMSHNPKSVESGGIHVQSNYELGQTEWSKIWSKIFWVEPQRHAESANSNGLSSNGDGDDGPSGCPQVPAPQAVNFSPTQIAHLMQLLCPSNMVNSSLVSPSSSSSSSEVTPPRINRACNVRTLLPTPEGVFAWGKGVPKNSSNSLFVSRPRVVVEPQLQLNELSSRGGGFISKKKDAYKQRSRFAATQKIKTNAFGEVVESGHSASDGDWKTGQNGFKITPYEPRKPESHGVFRSCGGSWVRCGDGVSSYTKSRKASRLAKHLVNRTNVGKQFKPVVVRVKEEDTDKGIVGKGRKLVIDGASVAFHFGDRQHFDWEGIHICVKYFQMLGCSDITVVTPHDKLEPGQSKNVYFAEQLKNAGLLSINLKDVGCKRLILKLAIKHKGVVISNGSWKNMRGVSEPNLEYISKQTVGFHFANHSSSPEFVVSDPPFGCKGPSLRELLLKSQLSG